MAKTTTQKESQKTPKDDEEATKGAAGAQVNWIDEKDWSGSTGKTKNIVAEVQGAICPLKVRQLASTETLKGEASCLKTNSQR